MAKRQAGEQRRGAHAAQVGHHVLEAVAAVQRALAPIAEGAQQHRLLALQHAGLLQLQQQTLHPVGVLADVLQKQDATLDLGPVRRAQQRDHHCQVAAPQQAAAVQPVEAGLGAEAHRLQLARHRLGKTFTGDLVHATGLVAAAEIVAGHRPVPAAGAGVGQQAQLQRGEIGISHPARALLDRSCDARPVDAVEQAAQAIAAAAGHGHCGRGIGHPVEGVEPGLVAAGKALVAGAHAGVQRHRKAQGCEALARQLERGGAQLDARRREDMQGGHGGNGLSGPWCSVASPMGMVGSGGRPELASGSPAVRSARSARSWARRSAKKRRSRAAAGSAIRPP